MQMAPLRESLFRLATKRNSHMTNGPSSSKRSKEALNRDITQDDKLNNIPLKKIAG